MNVNFFVSDFSVKLFEGSKTSDTVIKKYQKGPYSKILPHIHYAN